MQLDLRQIADKASHRLPIDAATLGAWGEGLDCAPIGGGEAQLKHRRDGASVRVDGSIRGRVGATCASCGASLEAEVETSASATFRPESELSTLDDTLRDDEGLAGCELGAETMEEVGYSGEVIDLASWLRDEWRLGLPLALHCPDGACREAAASEPEPPIDPRWAGLQALRDQLD